MHFAHVKNEIKIGLSTIAIFHQIKEFVKLFYLIYIKTAKFVRLYMTQKL